MGGFSDGLNRFAAATEARGDSLVHDVVADMAAQLVERSPAGIAEGWKVGFDGGSASVVNTMPEAVHAEYGHAGALPAAMVGLAVVEFPEVVERVAKRLLP